MSWLKQSTTVTIRLGPFLDKTDGVTEEVGLGSMGIEVSKNHAAFGARNSATATAHDAEGWYSCELDTTDTGTLGSLIVKAHAAATHLPVWREFMVVPAMVFDSMVAGTDVMQADVTQLLGTAWLAPGTAGTPDVNVKLWNALTTVALPVVPTVAGRTLDLSVGGEAGLDWANIGSPTTPQNLSATNFDVDQVVASVSGAVGSVTGAVGSVTGLTAATVHADLDDIQARLPAALTADGNMKTDTLYLEGAVWIDTGGGAAGTTNYVHGIVTNPNSSMANSRTIADAVGLKKFIVLNGSSVTLDQGYINYTFEGELWTLALASRNIAGSHFEGANVSGLSTGTAAEFADCILAAVTIANASKFTQCGLSDTFTLQAAGTYIFTQCFSATLAGVDAVIDFGALGATTVAMRDYAGGLEVRNMAAGDVLAFVGQGRLTIAASCTAGTVLISGNVNLVNNGSGQTITDSSRFSEDQTFTSLQADTDDIQTRLPAALVGGRMDASVGAMAADVLTAAATAADFGTEVGSAVWATATRALTDKAGFSLSAAGVTAIWAEVIEGTRTAVQMMRGFASVLLGKLSGAATVTNTFRDIDDTKARVTATVDADGNRSAITLDLT